MSQQISHPVGHCLASLEHSPISPQKFTEERATVPKWTGGRSVSCSTNAYIARHVELKLRLYSGMLTSPQRPFEGNHHEQLAQAIMKLSLIHI